MASADVEVPFDMAVPGYPTELTAAASRADGGGRPNPILLPMIENGLSWVLRLQPARVAATVQPLVTLLRQRCEELGLWVPRATGPHIIGVGPGQRDACPDQPAVTAWVAAAAAHLKRHKIYVSAKVKVLRVAPHVYNTVEDVEVFVRVLGEFVAGRRGAKL
mmetsp:Transcript_12820/g.31959  ORF Transcript_12820/g.31959 Transcript_12820/m.31959 type:complete len:162 (+) Transcript_12820:777-1262(+)